MPSEVVPVNNSVLMQILVSALYSSFISVSEQVNVKKEVSFENASTKEGENKAEDTVSMKKIRESCSSSESVALAAAESLCSIGNN